MQGNAIFVEVAHIRADATFEVKAQFVAVAFVDETEAQPFVEVRHLAEALGQGFEVVLDRLDDGRIGHEGRLGAVFFGRTDLDDLADGCAAAELLVVLTAGAIDRHFAVRR